MTTLLRSLATICLLAAASLTDAIETEADSEVELVEKEQQKFGVDWNWYSRGKDWSQFDTCMTGTKQSPIDLSSDFALSAQTMTVQGSGFENFPTIDLKLTDGMASIDVAGDGLVKMTLGDGTQVEYTPLYAQFKAPSEHCFDKVRYDVEMQLFMAKPGETLQPVAAIAVFWDDSANDEDNTSSDFLQSMHLDHAHLRESTLLFDVDFKKELGQFDFRYFYSYEGSLTSPPCSEGIQWTVLSEPRPVDPKQVAAIKAVTKDNTDYGKDTGCNIRGPQPLNQRQVYQRTGAKAALAALSTTATLLYTTIILS